MKGEEEEEANLFLPPAKKKTTETTAKTKGEVGATGRAGEGRRWHRIGATAILCLCVPLLLAEGKAEEAPQQGIG